jgi:hypothetical protein
MLQTIVRSFVVSLVPVVLGGCGAYDSVKDAVESDDGGGSAEALVDATPTPAAGPDPLPTPLPTAAPSNEVVPADFAGVEWVHGDISGWGETASLSVSIGGGTVRLDYDKTRVWRAINGVNANPWIFVFRNGHWIAATWEWLGFGQTTKPMSTVNGAHIGRRQLIDFQPRSGEIYGFMVSGLIRDGSRNVLERTPVVMARWP